MSINFCGHNLGPQNEISKIRSLPYAFTEQGVAMLATVIKTDVAVNISIKIMDAFVSMRKYIKLNNYNQRISNIENKIIEHDNKFKYQRRKKSYIL